MKSGTFAGVSINHRLPSSAFRLEPLLKTAAKKVLGRVELIVILEKVTPRPSRSLFEPASWSSVESPFHFSSFISATPIPALASRAAAQKQFPSSP
jgi:hypothetical protein